MSTETIPEFPLFDVDDTEMAFGADKSRYFGGASWDAAKGPSRELSRQLRDETKAFEGLMFRGGKLTDFGFQVKPDLDRRQVQRAIRALLGSWDVSHEQKEATVALAIHRWCDPVEQKAGASA